MVDALVRKQPHFVQSFVEELFFAPIYIPVFVVSFFIASVEHGGRNTVIKKSFELDFGAE